MIVEEVTAEHEEMGGRIVTFYIHCIVYNQYLFSDGIFFTGKTG